MGAFSFNLTAEFPAAQVAGNYAGRGKGVGETGVSPLARQNFQRKLRRVKRRAASEASVENREVEVRTLGAPKDLLSSSLREQKGVLNP